jgi:hypothetical protein
MNFAKKERNMKLTGTITFHHEDRIEQAPTTGIQRDTIVRIESGKAGSLAQGVTNL